MVTDISSHVDVFWRPGLTVMRTVDSCVDHCRQEDGTVTSCLHYCNDHYNVVIITTPWIMIADMFMMESAVGSSAQRTLTGYGVIIDDHYVIDTTSF